MTKQWYFRDATQQKIGPLSPDEFAQRVAAGEVAGQTRVWCSGLADWAAYEAVLAHQRTVPPPLPVAAPEPVSSAPPVSVATPVPVSAAQVPAPASAPLTPGEITFEHCEECREQLPSHLFRELGGQRICGNCIRESHAKRNRAKLRLATGVNSGWFWKHLAKVAVIGLILGFARIGVGLMNLKSRQAYRSMPADASKFEPWVQAGPANWPQIALSSEARFRSGGALHDASAFLVELPEGGCVAIAGAASLLSGEMRPPLALRQVGAELVDWRFFPKAHPDAAMLLTRVAGQPADYNGSEAIALAVPPETIAPAVPLKLRAGPLRSGETVFVIVPSADPQGKQLIAKGRTTRLPQSEDAFMITTDLAVPEDALAGGAIVDLKGHLAGIAIGAEGSLAGSGEATTIIRAASVENFARLLESAAGAAPRTAQNAVRPLPK